MRIAYDITQTGGGKAGCGYLAFSLIQNIAQIDSSNEYLLLSSFGENYWDKNTSPSACGVRNKNFKHGLRHVDHAAAQRFWRKPPDDLDAALGNPDIVHANNFYCPSGLNNAKLVYTLYDLNFIMHPGWTTEANRLICFDGVFQASLFADKIIAISEYSREHFLRTFPHYSADKVQVVYPASRYTYNPNLMRPVNLPDSVVSGKFWLCVGTLEPRKNHLSMLEAYAQHKKNNRHVFPLVHAGGPGWLMDDFKENIVKLGLEEDILLLGYVEDETLQWLYQNCYAFLYPSLFEGFGLPVLEAMSLGAAVITSNSTSIPEIVGESGVLVNPMNVTQIANAMNELSENESLHVQYKKDANQQASLFSWEKAARQTINIYEQIC